MENVQVKLIEGKVSVTITDSTNNTKTSKTLTPGESLLGSKIKNDEATIEKEKDIETSKWSDDGIISFKSATFTDVQATLETWYGIQIINDKDLKTDELLTFRINTEQLSLEEVIEGINKVASYQLVKETHNTYQFTIKTHNNE